MNITTDIFYVGVNDHTTDLFEGQFPIPNGMSYNSYVILDEKVAVLDTVDRNFTEEWLGNVREALAGRKPDYLVVHHMEPDHAANIANFVRAYPEVTIAASAKAFTMMEQFFPDTEFPNRLVLANGSVLELGKHSLTFLAAPMVHWPEVMVSFDSCDHILFSADAFGKFGALDVDEPWDDEARRYYIGIVGKHGVPTQTLLKKAASLDIHRICPLHGPALTEDLSHYLNLYQTWSSYEPEESGIVIAYTSVYGNTAQAVRLLADSLIAKGCQKVAVYDLCRCDMSAAVADAFRYDRLVLATTTYYNNVFPFMSDFLQRLTERNLQKRKVALIENGSWGPLAAKQMKEKLSGCKNLQFAEQEVRIRSALNAESREAVERLAEELA
ncbi:MAG: FprA family A-type flavoprotein [Lachnospiraceae bacterium]|nr:FprA family A-type flavoprotein [Lachnospiraceae bacterium]